MPNTVIPAPPGAVLVRQGSRRPLIALAIRDTGHAPLPITSLRCWVCDTDVIVGVTPAVAGPRVDSDSRHGYSAIHTACGVREAARR